MKIKETEKNEVAILAKEVNLSVDEFLKSRTRILGQLKSFHQNWRKKQDAKRSWRLNRRDHLRGIMRWHSSTAGKSFHRQLGRFLSLRAPLYKAESANEDLVALCSLKTSLVIESLYIVPDFDEHIQSSSMIEMAIGYVDESTTAIQSGKELSEEAVECLKDLCTKIGEKISEHS